MSPATTRPALVLASGSRYRAAVLRDAGFEPVIDAPDVDERELDHLFAEDPIGLALALARLKATAVAPRHPDSVVLAGDQVGVLEAPDGPRQLTKQPTEQGAVDQLAAMSGTTHRLVNGIAVARTDADGAVVALVEGIDVQHVTMRAFTRDEALAYVRRFEPFDSAGSYRLEDQDRMAPEERFVVEVRGEDPSGVLGVPLPLVRRLLRAVGSTAVDPTDAPSFLPRLEAVLRSRLQERPEGSYSLTLLTDPVAAQRKIMEEAFEVCLELNAGTVDAERAASEAADLVFHLMCGLTGAGVAWSAVEAELAARHAGGG